MCSKEDLQYKIQTLNMSYESIAREYGVSGTTIKYWANKLGIPLSSRRKINKKEHFNRGKKEYKICKYCGASFEKGKNTKGLFCSVDCANKFRGESRYKYFLEHPEEFHREMHLTGIKKYILEEQNHKCDICGMNDEWNGKLLIFILDHIDGRATHNVRDNLRLICPNCESQLDTYKSKNKNSKIFLISDTAFLYVLYSHKSPFKNFLFVQNVP